jgi:hypothetical protein
VFTHCRATLLHLFLCFILLLCATSVLVFHLRQTFWTDVSLSLLQTCVERHLSPVRTTVACIAQSALRRQWILGWMGSLFVQRHFINCRGYVASNYIRGWLRFVNSITNEDFMLYFTLMLHIPEVLGSNLDPEPAILTEGFRRFSQSL